MEYDSNCIICNNVCSARSYSCGHFFHEDCMDKWFHSSHNLTCPLCRTFLMEEITVKNIFTIFDVVRTDEQFCNFLKCVIHLTSNETFKLQLVERDIIEKIKMHFHQIHLSFSTLCTLFQTIKMLIIPGSPLTNEDDRFFADAMFHILQIPPIDILEHYGDELLENILWLLIQYNRNYRIVHNGLRVIQMLICGNEKRKIRLRKTGANDIISDIILIHHYNQDLLVLGYKLLVDVCDSEDMMGKKRLRDWMEYLLTNPFGLHA